MSWFQLETSFPTHPKVVGLTDKAFRLHVCALAYCAENLTDGEIDPKTLRVLGANANLARPYRVAQTLVKARLWDVNPFETDSYRIHDYGKHQRTKADVERERASARERMRRLRSPELQANGSSERSAEVRQQSRSSSSIEKGSIPKGPSKATTNVVDAVQTFLESYCIHLPDEDVVRDELVSRFHLGEQALDEAQETWRKLRAEAQGSAST